MATKTETSRATFAVDRRSALVRRVEWWYALLSNPVLNAVLATGCLMTAVNTSHVGWRWAAVFLAIVSLREALRPRKLP